MSSARPKKNAISLSFIIKSTIKSSIMLGSGVRDKLKLAIYLWCGCELALPNLKVSTNEYYLSQSSGTLIQKNNANNGTIIIPIWVKQSNQKVLYLNHDATNFQVFMLIKQIEWLVDIFPRSQLPLLNGWAIDVRYSFCVMILIGFIYALWPFRGLGHWLSF